MIHISSAIPAILARLNKLPPQHPVILLTYKKDRSLTISKIDADVCLIIRNGYKKEHLQVPSSRLAKTLKALLKKEFPRSNKAHLHSDLFKL